MDIKKEQIGDLAGRSDEASRIASSRIRSEIHSKEIKLEKVGCKQIYIVKYCTRKQYIVK